MNVFVGNLTTVSDAYENTIFEDLQLTQKLFSHADMEKAPSSGFTITLQKTMKKTNEYSGELRIHLPFLCFTKDSGYFKDNMTLHAARVVINHYEEKITLGKSFKELINTEKDVHIPEKEIDMNGETPIRAAQIQILLKLETDQDFFGNIDDSYWKYFRNQEKKHFEGKDEENSMAATAQELAKSHLLALKETTSLNREKIYLVLLKKKNKHKNLLEEFEVDSMKYECRLDKSLISIGEISVSFAKPEDFTSILNVSCYICRKVSLSHCVLLFK